MTETEILVTYFSRTGNTEQIAEFIGELTDGDLFRILTVEPYPDDYTETTVQAQDEKNADARPALSTHLDDMDRYDVIFIGYPIWWSTFPMAVVTFLEEYDFTGKTVIPFCTHQGSGSGTSFTDIRAMLPQATVPQGFFTAGAQAAGAKNDVANWLSTIVGDL